MIRQRCPQCTKLLISPYGINSPVLFVGEYPGYEEVREGLPLSGRLGDILQSEVKRAGLQLNRYRLMSMWQHEKDEKGCDVKWHVDQMIKEFSGNTHILLMGHDAVQAMSSTSVANYAGLQLKLKDFPKIHFWVAPSPTSMLHGPIGDFRMSIERFAQDVRKGQKS